MKYWRPLLLLVTLYVFLIVLALAFPWAGSTQPQQASRAAYHDSLWDHAASFPVDSVITLDTALEYKQFTRMYYIGDDSVCLEVRAEVRLASLDSIINASATCVEAVAGIRQHVVNESDLRHLWHISKIRKLWRSDE